MSGLEHTADQLVLWRRDYGESGTPWCLGLLVTSQWLAHAQSVKGVAVLDNMRDLRAVGVTPTVFLSETGARPDTFSAKGYATTRAIIGRPPQTRTRYFVRRPLRDAQVVYTRRTTIDVRRTGGLYAYLAEEIDGLSDLRLVSDELPVDEACRQAEVLEAIAPTRVLVRVDDTAVANASPFYYGPASPL